MPTRSSGRFWRMALLIHCSIKACCVVVLAEISPTNTTAWRVTAWASAGPASPVITSAKSARRHSRIRMRCDRGKGSDIRRQVRKTSATTGMISKRRSGCSNVSIALSFRSAGSRAASQALPGLRDTSHAGFVARLQGMLQGGESGVSRERATQASPPIVRTTPAPTGRWRGIFMREGVAAAEEPPFSAEHQQEEGGDPRPDFAQDVWDAGATAGEGSAIGDRQQAGRGKVGLQRVKQVDHEGPVTYLPARTRTVLRDLVD